MHLTSEKQKEDYNTFFSPPAPSSLAQFQSFIPNSSPPMPPPSSEVKENGGLPTNFPPAPARALHSQQLLQETPIPVMAQGPPLGCHAISAPARSSPWAAGKGLLHCSLLPRLRGHVCPGPAPPPPPPSVLTRLFPHIFFPSLFSTRALLYPFLSRFS